MPDGGRLFDSNWKAITRNSTDKIGFLDASHPLLRWDWPDRYFVLAVMRDYCMGSLPSRGVRFGAIVTGAGGLYPSTECGRFVL